MKNLIKSLVAIAAFGALSVAAYAQPAPKIFIVDMAKLYDNHYKTQEQNTKIQADEAKAQEEVVKMNKEGQTIVDEYKALMEQANNPTASAEAKSRAQNDAQRLSHFDRLCRFDRLAHFDRLCRFDCLCHFDNRDKSRSGRFEISACGRNDRRPWAARRVSCCGVA